MRHFLSHHRLVGLALLCTLHAEVARAQTTQIDSLEALLAGEVADTTRCLVHQQLAWSYGSVDTAQAFWHVTEALHWARVLERPNYAGRAYYALSAILHFQGQHRRALLALDSAKEAAAATWTDLQKLRLYNLYGILYDNLQQWDSALVYYHQAVNLVGADHPDAADPYANLGAIHMNLGQLDEAQRYYGKALRMYEEVDYWDGMANVYLNWGDILKADSALDYYQRAIDLYSQAENEYGTSAVHFSIGEFFYERGQYDSAQVHTQICLDYHQGAGLSYYRVLSLMQFGKIFVAQGHGERALEYLNPLVGEPLDDPYLEENRKETLAQALALVGRYEEAFPLLHSYTQWADSLHKAEVFERVARSDARFQNEQQARIITQQELDLARQTETRNRLIIASLAALLILLGVFLVVQRRMQNHRRQTELALTREQVERQQLEEFDRQRSQFFANISHEFRTPLTLIKGPLQDTQQAGQNGVKHLPMILRNVQRLEQLIGQLLDLSRLESGHLALQARRGSLLSFLRPLFSAYTSYAEHRGMHYQWQVPTTPVAAVFDADKLDKVLNNLISNAFKFTPEEGSVRIQAELLPTDQLRVQVGDTGIGISESELPHIFDRFYQVDPSDRRETQGSGIGLALTQELVKLMGGTLSVDSQPNEGSVFVVEVPLQQVAEEELGEGADKEPQPSEVISGWAPPVEESPVTKGKPKVLVVEDHADMRGYLKDLLTPEYQLLEAVDGEEGLALTEQNVPDLIISDVMMPRMDGMEFVRRLRKNAITSHIPVLMLTAKTTDKLVGLEEGVDVFLTKPFEAQELKVHVENLLGRYQRVHAYVKDQGWWAPEQMEVWSSMDQRFMAAFTEAMQQGYSDETFGVPALSDGLALSRSQLHRKLKALTGQSPSELLRQFRLQKAHALLIAKAATPSEVAYRVGFSNLPYFSRCFKDQYGLPPSQVGGHQG
ncbi:MAG: ATP-binding protein [Bacteroidota bacterium]